MTLALHVQKEYEVTNILPPALEAFVELLRIPLLRSPDRVLRLGLESMRYAIWSRSLLQYTGMELWSTE